MTPHFPDYLVVVVGPTAVGKTQLCIQLAQRLGTEIISCDARQVYQHMNIGTAKPTAAEQQAVRHHMVDMIPLERQYTAADFAEDSLVVMQELGKKSSAVIMTGGSGLYMQAACEGLPLMPPIDAAVRTSLLDELAKKGLPHLAEALKKEDPTYYQEADLQNSRRVLHALEVTRSGKYSYSYYRQQPRPKRPFKIIKIGLFRERDLLKKRIAARVEQMMTEGLLEEVRSLRAYQGYSSLATIGYQEFFPFFEGKITLKQAIEDVKIHTNQYAKRQMTWFRRDPAIAWFSPEEEGKIIDYITAQMKDRQDR